MNTETTQAAAIVAAAIAQLTTATAVAVTGGRTAGAFFKVSVAGEYFVHVVV